MVLVIGEQVLVMALLLLLGVFCAKKSYLTEETTDALSKIVLRIVNPAVIFVSYLRERDRQLVWNLLASLGLSFAVMFVAIMTTRLILHNSKSDDVAIERISAVYSNCGFMGIPLIQALFGSTGVLYLTGFITVFNILIWTHGVMSISKTAHLSSVVKILKSPSICAIFAGLLCFFLGIPLPAFVKSVFTHVGSMNTPLAMLVAGATIARTDLRETLRCPRAYLVAALKLLILPMLSFALLFWVPVAQEVKMTIVLAMATPTAVMCTLFAITEKKNEKYAAALFAITTVFSIVTLPLIGILF